ncbi:MAG: HEPN domain-containing protein [Bacteroidales bacterium]|nr:HEPN domain-containing protein [Bacteroidales bacterium]
MLSEENRRIVVALELEKSKRFFSEVAQLVNLKFWDTTINRLYYAVFHAASALLINKGIEVKTHKGVSLMLGEHFVKNGVLTMDEAKFYARLQNLRERGDYNCSYNATEEDVLKLIEPSSNFIKKVEQIINNLPMK